MTILGGLGGARIGFGGPARCHDAMEWLEATSLPFTAFEVKRDTPRSEGRPWELPSYLSKAALSLGRLFSCGRSILQTVLPDPANLLVPDARGGPVVAPDELLVPPLRRLESRVLGCDSVEKELDFTVLGEHLVFSEVGVGVVDEGLLQLGTSQLPAGC